MLNSSTGRKPQQRRQRTYLCFVATVLAAALSQLFVFVPVTYLSDTIAETKNATFTVERPSLASARNRDTVQSTKLKKNQGFASTNPSLLSSASRKILPGDKDCVFRDSPLYRSIFVYPSPGEPEWEQGRLSDEGILSSSGKAFSPDFRYPWQPIEERTRRAGDYHFRLKDARALQYTTELIVREILMHPDSCLRSYDPETASLFYVPYMVSIEWHNGTQYPKSFETSPYGRAILDLLDEDTNNPTAERSKGWEEVWGYTREYWDRRRGADHILVFSEGCHGLSHPRGLCGGHHVMLHAQRQLSPPIVVHKDTSRSFVEAYPACAAKNLVVPAPNPDGRWFNGRVKTVAAQIALNASFHDDEGKQNGESPPRGQRRLPSDPQKRPLAYYYKAGNHGSCQRLRKVLEKSFEECSPPGRYLRQKNSLLPKGYHFPHAFRHATFCPCPGGDTPNSKRYFDAILAGCIPLVLSADFVWPYSTEIPGGLPSSSPLPSVSPGDFSIRLRALDFLPSSNENVGIACLSPSDYATNNISTIQTYVEGVPQEEIVRLREGLAKAARWFSYYEESPGLPNHPLRERILPTGGAAHALVAALADRAHGRRWPACRDELATLKGDPLQTDSVHVFRC